MNNKSIFSSEYQNNEIIKIPISHGEGNYQADKSIINELESENRIIFRYSSESGQINDSYNPNGSINNIAGIINKEGNVLGMMPHPENLIEPEHGGTDGRGIFESALGVSQSVAA